MGHSLGFKLTSRSLITFSLFRSIHDTGEVPVTASGIHSSGKWSLHSSLFCDSLAQIHELSSSYSVRENQSTSGSAGRSSSGSSRRSTKEIRPITSEVMDFVHWSVVAVDKAI